MGDEGSGLETGPMEATDLKDRIDRLNELAWELRDTDPSKSQQLSETAYQLACSSPFDKQPYLQGLVVSLRGLAHANRRAGHLSQSLSQSMQALTHLANTSLPAIEADTLQNIAIIMGSFGNYAEGLEYGFKALNLSQAIEDQQRKAHILSSIGVIYNHSKNTEESLGMFGQALQLNRKLGEKRYEGQTLNNMALAHNARGDYLKALRASRRALRLAEETGFAHLIVTATGTIGETYLAMGRYAQASHCLENYLTAARAAGVKRDETWALILLGETNLRKQGGEAPLTYLCQALEIAQQVGFRSEQARCHELLAEAYEQLGDLKKALDQLKLFHQTKETVLNETIGQRIANLQIIQQLETVKRDAEIHFLKTIELQREIEERKKTELALKELATIDPLTGILNRREFFIIAETEVQGAIQRQKPLSTILLDIDYFKDINDRYGHAIGDQVLVDFAQILRQNLRTEEIVGRIGGDEFAIVLPGSDQLQGQQIAQRLQNRIGSYSFNFKHGAFLLSASIGIAELDYENDKGIGVLLNHADQAMYSAKRAGRNRIVIYRPDKPPSSQQ